MLKHANFNSRTFDLRAGRVSVVFAVHIGAIAKILLLKPRPQTVKHNVTAGEKTVAIYHIVNLELLKRLSDGYKSLATQQPVNSFTSRSLM